ncbi:MAG TPA: hypothetical protein PLR56_09160 [Brevefilum sp.]|jgi:hypothetical protein|nr:hypothetical protein [Brevefilum sp.]
MKKKEELKYGIERLMRGDASVMRVPVHKGDRIEWNVHGYMTRILRDGKPIWWLGKKIGWRPDGEELVVLHLIVDQAPVYIWEEEPKLEGYESAEAFERAFAAAYGEEALYKPAWRIRVGVNKLVFDEEEMKE